MMLRVIVPVIVPVILASSVAAAEAIHVRAEHCATLDSNALDQAVGRELALDLELAARAQNAAISLECPDGLHAYVRADPGGLVTEVDLGDEPTELRVKLVALAIAELIVAVDSKPAPLVSSRDNENPLLVARAKTKRKPMRGPGVTARAGVRVFADELYPMASMSADLELGPIQIGVLAALGESHLFTSVPYLFTGTVGRRLLCSPGGTSVCMVARGDVGLAGVSIYESAMEIAGRDVRSFYADLTTGIELRRQIFACKALADLEVGFAHGLVVDALSLVHLNGPFATAGVGVQW
jgi:hypothetical protein